ncbi:MAG: histidine kinase, partial [Bacteroidia bacterium]
MDKFFTYIKKYYTSFAIRNGILISLGIIFGQLENSLREPEDRVNPFSLALLSLTNYGLVVFYNHIILRLFLFQKRIILFVLLFVSYMVFLTLFIMYGTPSIMGDPFKTNFLQLLPDVIFNTILISLFYFFHYFFLQYIKQQEIELLNHKTEIENLKQQLNPHFLFNSLNNLYGVSLSNPAEVSNKIVELSDLLKYQIETSKKDYSSLEGEKEFIEKYISYSKWKLQNITINTTESGEAKNYRLTPMIFSP